VALRMSLVQFSGQLGVHRNVTALDPSAVVPMFDTTCCEPLFMQ
jgi:hypothetical protein